jgi:hypothetical protein
MGEKAALLLAQVAIFGISVGGYVALAIQGEVTAEYVALIGPVLGAAFLTTHLRGQDKVLGKIHENTNGILKQRVKEAVREVHDERQENR